MDIFGNFEKAPSRHSDNPLLSHVDLFTDHVAEERNTTSKDCIQ